MTINEISKLLGVCHKVNDALLIIGEAGVGKSQVVKQYAKDNDFHLEDLRLGNQEIGDLIGMPEVKDGVTNWTEPVWLHRMNTAGKPCVLFLDELNRAQTDVKASALQIVLDHSIHQHKLPENTLIVAAINPDDSEQGQEYQVDELDPALLDRFLQVKVNIDTNSWLQWARTNKINPVIIGFISENPKFLYNIPKNKSRIATPRSWASLSKYVDIFNEVESGQRLDIITGKIGPELAVRFNLYYQESSNRVSVDDIIDLTEKHYKDKNVQEVSTHIAAFIESKKLEELAVRELLNQTFDKLKKYLDNRKSNSLEDHIDDKSLAKLAPLFSLLYSMNLESLAAFVYNLKENDKDNFSRIAAVDYDYHNAKPLYSKLLSKK